MSERLRNKFASLKQEKRPALITFTMSFDPDERKSLEILEALPESGADIVEFGIPFSDPMADGPTIQEAGIRALNAGAKLDKILKNIKKFRDSNVETPAILMGYYNPILNFGHKNFIIAAKECGVDGLIIVDLPPEQDEEVLNLCDEYDIALIKLITPTTDESRLDIILSKARGFLYFVSVTGVTGTKTPEINDISNKISFFKKHTDIPIVVGFGIKTPEFAKQVADVSDGVVVGSSLVNIIAKNSGKVVEEVSKVVRSFACALSK